MVVDQFEVPRQQIISDLGGKHSAGHWWAPSRASQRDEMPTGCSMPYRAQPERGALHPRAAEGDDLRGAGRPAGQGWRYGRARLSPGPAPKPRRRAGAAERSSVN